MNVEKTIHDLKNELEFKKIELNIILELTKAVNTNQSIDELLSLYEFFLGEQLGFPQFALFNKDNGWRCMLKSGVKGQIKKVEVEKDLYRFKKITLIENSSNPVLDTFDVVIPVYHNEDPIAFLLLKDREFAGQSEGVLKAVRELGFIQMLTNILVVAIENKRLYRENLIQIRLKKDLEIASEMQRLLFPNHLPSDRRIDLSANYIARHEVSGDYYDFIPLNNNEFMLCIADVSGKGIGAAMLMANFQGMLRTMLSIKGKNLNKLVKELNERVMNAANGEKFITFFIGLYNSSNRVLKYINAGHNNPILTNGKYAQFLDCGTIGLGMMEELPFIEPGEVEIPFNSTIVMYTDGVVELQNKEGEYFQADRLIKLIHSFYPLKMEDLNNLVFSKIDEFRKEEELKDDIALFTCRIF